MELSVVSRLQPVWIAALKWRRVSMKTIGTPALALALAVLFPGAAAAHHGWAWTEDEESRLVGTIVSIDYGNPHTSLRVRNERGTWRVDLAPPSASSRAGFVEGVARVGDRVSLVGHRSRDARELAFKAEMITVRGKTNDVYPGRPKTLKPMR
jgi:hypothetical protein